MKKKVKVKGVIYTVQKPYLNGKPIKNGEGLFYAINNKGQTVVQGLTRKIVMDRLKLI